MTYLEPSFFTSQGLPPHNNAAELEIRDGIVLQQNVRHHLPTPEGRQVFSVLISVARTCHKQGIFPQVAIEELMHDPSWRIFQLPEPKQQDCTVPVIAMCQDALVRSCAYVGFWRPEHILWYSMESQQSTHSRLS